MDPMMGGGMPPMDPMMGGGMPPMNGGMPPANPTMGDPSMDPTMGGDDAGMGDEVSPKKSIQQQCGKLASDMRLYFESADPEDANELSLWALQMINKAGAPVLNEKGKKKVIESIKGIDDEDFEGLDGENGGTDPNGLDPNAEMQGDAGMDDGGQMM